jgi:hypothetical protein
MAILHALLRHDRVARAKVELQEVIARHDKAVSISELLALCL